MRAGGSSAGPAGSGAGDGGAERPRNRLLFFWWQAARLGISAAGRSSSRPPGPPARGDWSLTGRHLPGQSGQTEVAAGGGVVDAGAQGHRQGGRSKPAPWWPPRPFQQRLDQQRGRPPVLRSALDLEVAGGAGGQLEALGPAEGGVGFQLGAADGARYTPASGTGSTTVRPVGLDLPGGRRARGSGRAARGGSAALDLGRQGLAGDDPGGLGHAQALEQPGLLGRPGVQVLLAGHQVDQPVGLGPGATTYPMPNMRSIDPAR